MFRSRYTSCVGTRPAAKIGKLTEWPLQRLYRGHAGQCSIPRKFTDLQETKLLHTTRLRRERRCVSMNVQNVQDVQRFKGSNVQDPENNLISLKPNFYTELGCELSGDAARLDTPPASALDGLI